MRIPTGQTGAPESKGQAARPSSAAASGCELPPLHRVGVFSQPLARLPHLRELIGIEELVLRPDSTAARSLDAVIGWGHKRTAQRARRFAERHSLPYWRIEDGFIRSVGLGPDSPPLSLVIDDRGIYYDARGPSWLEGLLDGRIGGARLLDEPALLERARRLRERIVAARLSKYNNACDALPAWLTDGSASGRPVVLVVDQTVGDASIEQGGASADSFARMLALARQENPEARLLVKTHPDVMAGRKRGYLTKLAREARAEILGAPVNPIELLARVERVYAVTSQIGFEALLLGKTVACFGTPFYAGWGLTDDRQPIPGRRTARRSLDQLVAAALILYPRYVDPVTGRRCPVEETVEHLALQREMFERNRGTLFCFGFSLWKRPFVRRYLRAPGNRVVFVRAVRDAKARGLAAGRARAIVWGSRETPELARAIEREGVPLARMEDGFLRSVGLGSDLTAPSSLVVDESGIYYDPSRPSDLETMLQAASFTPEELERAGRLRERIVARGLSKYNPDGERLRVEAGPGQRILFVPGQVADDASVRLGGGGRVSDNQSLLRAVREANPDAFVLYREHPDVVAGNREGRLPREAQRLYDQRADYGTLSACLEACSEVHVLTSFVGFEALLRGRRVVVHGRPFYAGWGLTEDREPIPRRTRRLGLDELVAGTLLRYPRYYSFAARAFVRCEDIVEELAARREEMRGRALRLPWPLRDARRLIVLARELRRLWR